MKRILLLLFLLLLFADAASAQVLRQRLRNRIFGPEYRVGTQQTVPVPAADTGRVPQRTQQPPDAGQIAEKVIGIVNLFTAKAEADASGSLPVEMKPVAVMSFACFKEFRRVAELVAVNIRADKGSDRTPVFFNALLNLAERIVASNFDTEQPLGIILHTDGVLLYPMMFSPLDLNSKAGQKFQKDFTEEITDTHTPENRRLAIRRTVFPWALGRLYVQQHNGWLFVATERQLNYLPDDPKTLLQGLDKEYLAAARFDLRNMPALTVKAGLSLAEMKAVGESANELEKAQTRLLIGYLRSLAEQADFLEYRFAYDEAHNDYVIEQKEIVKPKTERAKLLHERRNAESPLHQFYHPEHAILASHYVMPLTKLQQDQLTVILNELLGKKLAAESPQEPEKITSNASQNLGQLFSKISEAYYAALLGAVRSGHFDGATTVSTEHGILGAYNIADGEMFQQTINDVFVQFRAAYPDLYKQYVEKDFAETDGFKLTRVSFVPKDYVNNPLIGFLIPPELGSRETRLILAVRGDYVAFAIGQGTKPEQEIVKAITGMKTSVRVQDLFFIYSGYELGQAFALSGNPNRLARLKALAADTNPSARAFAVSKLTDDTKTLTLRISGLLTPSVWRLLYGR
ncbi:MAG: hypothetical protein LBT89_00155 [Planctomycetaceae bacterium]|jgi:hypothetical protein|nr:hypothetical protein [Planctomycetaceae bacterium]